MSPFQIVPFSCFQWFSFFPHSNPAQTGGRLLLHKQALRNSQTNKPQWRRDNPAQKPFQKRNVHNKPSLKLRALHNLHQFTAKTTGSIATRAMRAGAEYLSSNKKSVCQQIHARDFIGNYVQYKKHAIGKHAIAHFIETVGINWGF